MRGLVYYLVVCACLVGLVVSPATAAKVELPKDSDASYVVVCGVKGEARYEALKTWFETHRFLRELKAKCHFWTVVHNSAYYPRCHVAASQLPCVIVETNRGKPVSVCVNCTSAEQVAGKIRADIPEAIFPRNHGQTAGNQGGEWDCTGDHCIFRRHSEPKQTTLDPPPATPTQPVESPKSEPNPHILICMVGFCAIVGVALYVHHRYSALK